MRHATRYENGISVHHRPLAALITKRAVFLVFAGLLAAIVVVVGKGTAIEWIDTYLPVAVLLGVIVGTFVLFVREGAKVYAKVYEDLYKRP